MSLTICFHRAAIFRSFQNKGSAQVSLDSARACVDSQEQADHRTYLLQCLGLVGVFAVRCGNGFRPSEPVIRKVSEHCLQFPEFVGSRLDCKGEAAAMLRDPDGIAQTSGQ